MITWIEHVRLVATERKGFTTNHYGWMGGGTWLWTVIGILVVAL